MLRRTQQRLSCGANTLALVLVFGVVIIHVLHRKSAANVGPGDDQNVVFWFEAGGQCSGQGSYEATVYFYILPDVKANQGWTFYGSCCHFQATLPPVASLLHSGTAAPQQFSLQLQPSFVKFALVAMSKVSPRVATA